MRPATRYAMHAIRARAKPHYRSSPFCARPPGDRGGGPLRGTSTTRASTIFEKFMALPARAWYITNATEHSPCESLTAEHGGDNHKGYFFLPRATIQPAFESHQRIPAMNKKPDEGPTISVLDTLHGVRESALYYPAPECLAISASQRVSSIQVLQSRVSPAVFAVCCCCVVFGSRVGELLRVTVGDVMPGDVVLVRAEKGSSSYLIYLPGVYQWSLLLPHGSSEALLWPVSYRKVYEGARKLGLAVRMSTGKNEKVTHSGRYHIARGVNHIAGERVAGDVLGHRSAESINYYLKG